MWCIIPAAGKGSRIAPATDGGPKCLVEVAGEPLLHRLLRDVHEAVDAVCVIVPPPDEGGRRIEEAVHSWTLGVPVEFVTQLHRQGVADAVLQCESVVDDPFVVVMGDVYYEAPLAPYIAAVRSAGLPAVLVEPVAEGSRHAAGVVEIENGLVTAVDKRVMDGTERFRIAGAFGFPEDAFHAFRPARPSAGEFELEHVVTVLMESQRVYAVIYEGWRRNVNSPGDLEAVRRRCRRTGEEAEESE